MSVGKYHVCGIVKAIEDIPPDQSNVRCWGYDYWGDIQDTPPDQFKYISVGPFLSCGINMTDHVKSYFV